MNIIDLTQTISTTMPVYPGTEKPLITNATTIENEGFAEKMISMFSHTGTHIDAPGHILEGRNTLDQFCADFFIGKGIMIDISAFEKVEREYLQKFTLQIEGYADNEEAEFILFRTGWDKKWGTADYFTGFPTLSEDALNWLCSFNLKGIGFDCISADKIDSYNLPNHRIILGKNMIIIENLCNLDKLAGERFIFSCLPLKIQDADGSPVRAVGAIV